MLKVLRDVIKSLYYPLQSQGNWNTIFIDYEKPFVERIWTQMDEYRVYLHKIHPCAASEAFYHSHPWPSAMLLCSGSYETGMGFGYPSSFVESGPPKMGPFYLSQWSAYQMTDSQEWHYVRPIDNPCLTIMVTGAPYDDFPKSSKPKMRPLTKQEFDPIFDFFKNSENRVKMLEVLDRWIDK